jgi:hypothetical protein
MVEALLQQLGGTLTLLHQGRGAACLVAVPLQTHEAPAAGTQGLQCNDATALPQQHASINGLDWGEKPMT